MWNKHIVDLMMWAGASACFLLPWAVTRGHHIIMAIDISTWIDCHVQDHWWHALLCTQLQESIACFLCCLRGLCDGIKKRPALGP